MLLDGISATNLYKRGSELPTSVKYKCIGPVASLTDEDYKIIMLGELPLLKGNHIKQIDYNPKVEFNKLIASRGYSIDHIPVGEFLDKYHNTFTLVGTYLFVFSTAMDIAPIFSKKIKAQTDKIKLNLQEIINALPKPSLTYIDRLSRMSPIILDMYALNIFSSMYRYDRDTLENLHKTSLKYGERVPTFLDYFGYDVYVTPKGKNKIVSTFSKERLLEKINKFKEFNSL